MTRADIKIISYSVVLMMAAAAISALAELSTVGGYEVPQEPVVILSENFDDGSLSGWSLDTSGGYVALFADHHVSSPLSLGLIKYSEKKTCSASYDLGSAPNLNKRLFVDVDMMCWNSGGETDLFLKLMSGNKDMLTLAFHWSCIEWFDGCWHTICAFNPSSVGFQDKWYHVTISADINPGTFDIVVTDGDSYHSGSAFDVPFRSSTHAIDAICFQAGWVMMSNGGGEAFWIDNLVIRA